MRSGFEELDVAVLVIGAGAAGLRTAIELADGGMPCLVLDKRASGDAHTGLAAGGINAALGTMDPHDRWELHAADTLREGRFVCEPAAVERLARDAPARVQELADWGCAFDRTEDGRLTQRYFGAQTYRRTCFVGDRTGAAILQTLVDRARSYQIPIRGGVFVTRLLVAGGRVAGALGFDRETGRAVVVRAGAVVLAAGGSSRIYSRSTSREDENTGDAAALAVEAGAVIRDMEFVQFHPTGMVQPSELTGQLVTEAARGEGGRLYNARRERFMERYSPERMELDARDVVSRAVFEEIRAGRGTPDGAVLLDLSHLSPETIEQRLPELLDRFRGLGIDITREPIPIAPTAHYAMGGVGVDFETGATSVPGLYAVGEATGGLHGANRLGGNSLAETVVFGRLTGAHLVAMSQRRRAADGGAEAASSGRVPDPELDAAIRDGFDELERVRNSRGGEDARTLVAELGELLWREAGIVRDEDGLRSALAGLAEIKRRMGGLDVDPDPRGRGVEWAFNLKFMCVAAEAVLKSALLRRESRGAHFRADAPQTSTDWCRNVLCAATPTGELRLWTEPVPQIPPVIVAALAEERRPRYHPLE